MKKKKQIKKNNDGGIEGNKTTGKSADANSKINQKKLKKNGDARSNVNKKKLKMKKGPLLKKV